ncbi:MAG TPA: hypothetical protein VGD46_16625, partial [Rhizobacter sp.]
MSAVPDRRDAALSNAPRSSSALGDGLLYAALAVLVLLAWAISRRGYFKAGDDVGYWLGVAGGLMML